jgi:hypothetical protein
VDLVVGEGKCMKNVVRIEPTSWAEKSETSRRKWEDNIKTNLKETQVI